MYPASPQLLTLIRLTLLIPMLGFLEISQFVAYSIGQACKSNAVCPRLS